MSLRDLTRRSLLSGATFAAMAGQAPAQPAPDSIELWPSLPPGGPITHGIERIDQKGAITNVSRPRLIKYRPARPNGRAVLVIAGGGYASVEAGSEGIPACQWLQSIGVTAFELIYRLPPEGWSATAPLQDGQRAMRLIHAAATVDGIAPGRLGVIGFSAGGHLAGMTAVEPAVGLYPPVDAADATLVQPNFAALIYPVLSMMPPFDQTRSRRTILGDNPSLAESEAWSVERHVTAQAPPMFLAQSADDPIIPIENSLMMFNALHARRIPAELHVFQTGGHGWGLGRRGTEVHAWPALFVTWAMRNGFLPHPAASG